VLIDATGASIYVATTSEGTMDDLMTLDEVADLIRIDRKTLINWRSQRRPGIPVGFRPAGGRSVLFRRADVARWIDAQIADAAEQRVGGSAA
jgi:predicted DNA-binding transcriptional regulator AlpA